MNQKEETGITGREPGYLLPLGYTMAGMRQKGIIVGKRSAQRDQPARMISATEQSSQAGMFGSEERIETRP